MLSRQQSQQQLAGQLPSVQQLGGQQSFAALASVPEGEAVQPVNKVQKKKRKKKVKRRSQISQPGGMTDREKSMWLLEHCKVNLCCHHSSSSQAVTAAL